MSLARAITAILAWTWSFRSALAAFPAAFWFCYAANTLQMIAVSLLFRYADFVRAIGGDDVVLGWITGVGMVGAISARLVQGVAMDRIGVRVVWLLSLTAMGASIVGHSWLSAVGPAVYALRVLLMVGIAGAFGACLTQVSLLAPPGRMGEYISVVGSSGFLGLGLGPWLGDLLLADHADPMRMFAWAAGFVVAAWVFAFGVGGAAKSTVNLIRGRSAWEVLRETVRVLKAQHPGVLLLAGVAMGLGLGLPGVYVRALAADLGFAEVKAYFVTYAATAFALRLLSRTWTDVWGVRPMVLLGLIGLSASMAAYCLVWNAWTLAIPALATGAAHAVIFPAVLTGAGKSFAAEHRGLATNLIMGTFDLGGMLGQPMAATVLWWAGLGQWPRYSTMFLAVGAVLGVTTVVYWLALQRPDPDRVVLRGPQGRGP